MTSEDLDRVVAACGIGVSDLAVDLGCGTGEFLARIATRWRCRALGIDKSPFAIEQARRRSDAVEWHIADGRDHRLHSGDAALVASLGATHVFGSLTATLSSLVWLARPGGAIVIGDGYWRTDPTNEWLASLGARRGELGDRTAVLAAFATAGLRIELAVDAAPAHIDAYNNAWRANLERHLSDHTDDPDESGLTQALDDARRWHPDCSRYLGLGVFVARRSQ